MIAQSIIEFWFGIDAADVVTGRDQLWFAQSDEVDHSIKHQFGGWVTDALKENYSDLLVQPLGDLALILLLDQFTRNIYRGSDKAFSGDAIALNICKQGLSKLRDRQLTPSQRVFYYLPLEHSESVDDSEQCVALYKGLATETGKQYVDEHKALFQGYLSYAKAHQQIIQQFGRYPYRNAVIGRASTEAETLYLNSDEVNRFGQ